LRALCEDENKAAELFGEVVGAALRRRLADLRAADSLGALVAGRPTMLVGSEPRVIFDLTSRFRLICRSNHSSPPLDSNGAIAWDRVHRLQVVAIGMQPAHE
jgi:hypothetical protein